MLKEKLDTCYIPMQSSHPVVDVELMKTYSKMIDQIGFHVVPVVVVKSIKKIGDHEWDVTANNVYSFYHPDQEQPFLSGSFKTQVNVRCHDDGDIDVVDGKEIYFPETIKVLRQNDQFKTLVQHIAKPDSEVFFELVNTLKFAEYDVDMKVQSEGGLKHFEWGDYMAEFPISKEQLQYTL